jgi:SNF2 family DNA or RNA helicase
MPRDFAAEAAAAADLEALGFRRAAIYDREADFRIARSRFAEAAADLLERGWEVEAEGRALRRAGTPRFSVASGADWFELTAEVDFDGETAALPELLAAVRRKERLVRLGDGSSGLLPAAWLERYAPLAALAGAPAKGDDHGEVRFQAAQVGLLDALLAAESVASTDARFERLRARLGRRAELAPLPEPRGFHGTLRPYQREGLAWLVFLAETGLGGCLADDMGLGKTVQLLAFLQRRRLGRGGSPGPALIVAPRSVVFNWRAEAARFTPRMRVLEHVGADRPREAGELAAYDLVVTTYGTLRRDVLLLKEVVWSAVALDEAQAIKNPSTKTAKSARLLRSPVRFALTGTPVENHLGDLFSTFEFLNPGMLGRAKAVRGLLRRGGTAADRELETVRRGLAPLLLRRTKEQVLDDLPAKTETTLACELQGAERRRYDELLGHYRKTLLGRIESVGLERSRIQVLEALLRLRQAACHPGLLDPAARRAPSAKLATLLEHLEEATESGHKTLVFSQFTSFLDIVRRALDEQGTPYEYLDGRTRRREERVRRFQEDDGCPVFLISLKAGGQGLNLTAADYAFLLDPWWNPAVEAQAIDRAHRIGQTRPVFAYRLIARDTVEEKIVALQQEKRRLAEAIVTADRSLFREMTLEDLQRLLA